MALSQTLKQLTLFYVGFADIYLFSLSSLIPDLYCVLSLYVDRIHDNVYFLSILLDDAKSHNGGTRDGLTTNSLE